MKKIIIAIDGYSSCGKSSIARTLAHTLGYIYIDTGAMYRAVTLYALRHNLFYHDGSVRLPKLQEQMEHISVSFHYDPTTNECVTLLNGEDVENEIRGMKVSSHVSQIATISFVREAMLIHQRTIGKDGGVVMDGRDIGTTVFPHAELKIFVTASTEVRAQRRYDELVGKRMPANYNDILHNLKERDYIDTHRAISPLRQAHDAILLDNTNMTIEQQNAWAEEKAREKISSTIALS